MSDPYRAPGVPPVDSLPPIVGCISGPRQSRPIVADMRKIIAWYATQRWPEVGAVLVADGLRDDVIRVRLSARDGRRAEATIRFLAMQADFDGGLRSLLLALDVAYRAAWSPV